MDSLTIEGLREKDAVKLIVGDLVATCLWNPEITECHGDTKEHDITVWREEGVVKALVKHK